MAEPTGDLLDRNAMNPDDPADVSSGATGSVQIQYDVALSFAGEDREYVELVAKALIDAGVSVFYDKYERVGMWGKDLYVHLDEVYRLRAKTCVMFISRAYAAKVWTSHERRSAQARALAQGNEYILPARFDDTPVPGLPDTVAWIDLRGLGAVAFAELVAEKVLPRASRKVSKKGRQIQVAESLFAWRDRRTASESNYLDVLSDAVFGWPASISARDGLVPLDYETIQVRPTASSDGEYVDFVVQCVYGGGEPDSSISSPEWDSFCDLTLVRTGEDFGLVITNRVPDDQLKVRLQPIGNNVWMEPRGPRFSNISIMDHRPDTTSQGFCALVQLPGFQDLATARTALEDAAVLLSSLVDKDWKAL